LERGIELLTFIEKRWNVIFIHNTNNKIDTNNSKLMEEEKEKFLFLEKK